MTWNATAPPHRHACAASAASVRQGGNAPGAWRLARLAAELLKTQYNVSQVAVFGSLTHHDRFTQWSDVDLAAWGLTAANWLKASAAVRALAKDIELNVVDVATCSPELLAAIERDGIFL